MSGATIKRAPPVKLQSELKVFTHRGMVQLLALKAVPLLSSADLVLIATRGAACAEDMAERAAEMSYGLACLVANDADTVLRAGSFQGGQSVAQLLFHFGDLLQSIAGVSSAVASAAAELEQRGGQ